MDQVEQIIVDNLKAIYVIRLKASMDWENLEWRRKFWALLGVAVIPVLKRLDTEGHAPEIEPKDFVRIGFGIKGVLDMVERDFGRKSMAIVVGCVSEQLGHSLSPLDNSIVKKLVAEGFEIGEIKRAVSYSKNLENI